MEVNEEGQQKDGTGVRKVKQGRGGTHPSSSAKKSEAGLMY